MRLLRPPGLRRVRLGRCQIHPFFDFVASRAPRGGALWPRVAVSSRSHGDRHGIAENTIVVFTSDNGGLSAHARGGPPHVHNAPLRSGKGSAYEGGVRVPWIVRWPGVAPPGARLDAVVVTQDLFPTILSAASTATPEDHVLDGRAVGEPSREDPGGARGGLGELVGLL